MISLKRLKCKGALPFESIFDITEKGKILLKVSVLRVLVEMSVDRPFSSILTV